MGGYVPNTQEQRQDMLKAIGLSSMEDQNQEAVGGALPGDDFYSSE